MAVFELFEDDSVDWLKSLDDESVDLIVTDPAYESLEKHRKRGTTTRLKKSKGSSNQWFPIFPNLRFSELFNQMYRVLKHHRHLYVMCDQETAFYIKPIGERTGFTFWKPIIWDKMKMGTGYHYRAQYEMILFFEKGKRNLNSRKVRDVLRVPSLRGKDFYPTEKPIELSKVLIEQSSQPGELVADPFMGSASVGAAALQLGRMFKGCDISADSVALAETRLSETPMDFSAASTIWDRLD